MPAAARDLCSLPRHADTYDHNAQVHAPSTTAIPKNAQRASTSLHRHTGAASHKQMFRTPKFRWIQLDLDSSPCMHCVPRRTKIMVARSLVDPRCTLVGRAVADGQTRATRASRSEPRVARCSRPRCPRRSCGSHPRRMILSTASSPRGSGRVNPLPPVSPPLTPCRPHVALLSPLCRAAPGSWGSYAL